MVCRLSVCLFVFFVNIYLWLYPQPRSQSSPWSLNFIFRLSQTKNRVRRRGSNSQSLTSRTQPVVTKHKNYPRRKILPEKETIAKASHHTLSPLSLSLNYPRLKTVSQEKAVIAKVSHHTLSPWSRLGNLKKNYPRRKTVSQGKQ